MWPMICLDEVSLTYHSLQGETPALKDVSFSLKKGRFLAMVGPSGCGKSTVLSLIAGLLLPDRGRVLLEGRSVVGVSPQVGYMLQNDHLFPWRTIRENVLLGLEVQGNRNPGTEEQVDAMLAAYGLKAFAGSLPGQLSGGMRQRAALIRTLATDPKVLLLDEPFSALDHQTRLKLADEVKLAIARAGKTAILVTHDLGEAMAMADEVLVFSPRPAHVKKRFSMAELGEGTPFERRQHPAFSGIFQTLWKELDLHV